MNKITVFLIGLALLGAGCAPAKQAETPREESAPMPIAQEEMQEPIVSSTLETEAQVDTNDHLDEALNDLDAVE